MAGFQKGGRRGEGEERERYAVLLHPLRQRIMRLALGVEEIGAAEIAAGLGARPNRVAHHLRVLTRCGALEIVPRCRPAPPLYRCTPGGGWPRKMLGEIDASDCEDG